MSGFVKKIPSGLTVDQKFAMLQGMLEQLNQKVISLEKENAELKKLVDPEIKTRRLFELVREVNGHTSVMPDMSGYNTDHDRRYLIRSENPLHEFTYYGTRNRRLWRVGVEGGSLVTRFDKNLGVGTPDWTGDPYTNYPPNFD